MRRRKCIKKRRMEEKCWNNLFVFLFIIVISFHIFCYFYHHFSFLYINAHLHTHPPLATGLYLEKGLLYNVYTSKQSYPNIDTLEDLYNSKLEIHVRHPGLLTDIFGDGRDKSIVSNLRSHLRVSGDDFLNKRIVTKGDIAALERYANYEFENNKLVPREDGTSNLHLVAECPRWI